MGYLARAGFAPNFYRQSRCRQVARIVSANFDTSAAKGSLASLLSRVGHSANAQAEGSRT